MPGKYLVEATDGATVQRIVWDVYGTGPRKAKNVIHFVGDGLAIASRTAARILAKGIKQGKYYGQLSFDDMLHMALIGTSGVDSIITDSANAMSAYTTGHKSSVNALGVYASRAKDNLAHPKVETITELVKRKTRMSVGIVTDAELEDATPAGMVAHTRRRADKDVIAEQLFLSRADLLLSGGAAYFIPQKTGGSKRKDDNNFVEIFRRDGYAVVTTAAEMSAKAADPATHKLLGLFHPDNMDGALDRRFLKKGTVDRLRLPAPLYGTRVLVVDDEPVGLGVTTSVLVAMGLLVGKAIDGRQAVERVRTGDYALVLMVMQMPLLNGIDATRAIRALPQASALPIVAVTANAFDDDREACLAAGMNDHLGKPVSPHALQAMVLKWLERARLTHSQST